MLKKQKLSQDGFQVVEAAIVIAVLSVVGFVGFKVFKKNEKPPAANNTQTDPAPPPQTTKTSEFVFWQFNGNAWSAPSTPPDCENPLTLGSPMADITKATAVLYPGEIRGGDFKPHGGLALDGAATGNTNILAMRDGYLFRASRYLEDGEVQYILDFMDSCGIFYRYDHISVLAPDVMKEVDKLPPAQIDDSRTHRFDTPTFFKKGTVVATEVGHAKAKNFGYDIGVFDLRKTNEASKTAIYQTDQKRISDKEQSFYAICWWDYLPANEKAHVKALPTRGGKKGTSDYCQV